MKLTVGDEQVPKEVVVGVDMSLSNNKIKDAVFARGEIGGEDGDVKVKGALDVTAGNLKFGGAGTITDAVVTGGTLDKIASVGVEGEINVKGNANVGGEVYVDGSLTVGGSVLGSGPYVDASDGRFKKNVRGLGGEVLERIGEMEGVYYEIDVDAEAARSRGMGGGRGVEVGFVAQEVEAVFPELVETAEDGYKGVAYSRMVAVLVEGVKELKRENDALRGEMEQMRREIRGLGGGGGGGGNRGRVLQ
jgi:hypothetical protein